MEEKVYLGNSKDMLFKEGQRFKKDDILAKNSDYYIGDDPKDIIYSTGRICNVAVANLDGTMEDSSMVIEELSQKMASKITMKKSINLSVNSNVDFLIKKGDHINTGDPLIVFDTSFEDSSINDILGKLGDEFDETLDDFSKNKITSKYTGHVIDVIIYYNRDINEYSPSVQKILKKYIKENKAKYDLIQSSLGRGSTDLVNVKPIEKINSNKIKGEDVDGLLIEVYIEHLDTLGIGDKVTYGTALKTTISDVIPAGEEPFSEFNPDKKIECVFPPMSIVNRMTIDLYYQLYLNKALIGLKDRLKEIYGIK